MAGYRPSGLDILTVISTVLTLDGCGVAFYGPVFERSHGDFEIQLNLFQLCTSTSGKTDVVASDCSTINIWEDGLWDTNKYYALARIILPVGAFFGIISCCIAFMAMCSYHVKKRAAAMYGLVAASACICAWVLLFYVRQEEGVNWLYWYCQNHDCGAVGFTPPVPDATWWNLAGDGRDKEPEFGWGFWCTLAGAAMTLVTIASACCEAGVIRSASGTVYKNKASDNHAKVVAQQAESTV